MNLIFAVLLAAAGTNSAGTAKITSGSAYYDRAEGFAYFSGHVFVEDVDYRLHADRAYVFMDGTNDLKRIVALGHVAMTNDNKRAYGERATYYRSSETVVLTAGKGAPAEVREVTAEGDRTVRGAKIRFWTKAKQVEVLEAEITAPANGDLGGSVGKMMGK